MALWSLESLVCRCPVPEVLENRGRRGRRVLEGQGRVHRRLGEERRGLLEAYTMD